MDSADDVRGWCGELIDIFRARVENLPADVAEQIPNNLDYGFPCQIEIFCLKEPEAQLFVLTHDENRSDREIIVNGPYEGYEFVNEVEKVLQEPRWQKTTSAPTGAYMRGDESKIADRFVTNVYNFVNSVKGAIFRETTSPSPRHGMAFPYDGWVSTVHGSITEADSEEIMEDAVTQAENRVENLEGKPEKSKAEKSVENEKAEGFGSYLYPPIWVGSKPEKSFEQKVMGHEVRKSVKTFDSSFKDYILIVNRDGFLSTNIRDEKTAIEVLNTIFAAGIFKGYGWYAVRNPELTEVVLDEDQKTASSRSTQVTSIRSLLDARMGYPQFQKREEVSQEELEEIFKLAEKIYDDDELGEQVPLLIEAYTHYDNGEYSQSLLINWILVEQYLTSVLGEGLRERSVNRKRRDKILDSQNWSASNQLELLELLGKLDSDTYAFLDDMRKLRNEVVHEAADVSEREAQELMEVTLDLLGDRISDKIEDDVDVA